VVTTHEAPVSEEAAATKTTATKATVAEAAATKATVAEPAVVTEAAAATKTTATKATVAEAAATKATVAEATVAEAVATPGRRGDVHGADYSRDRRRRGGISCWGCTEKHCTGHRACADCAGGDPAG
jgi:hypothetical protein